MKLNRQQIEVVSAKTGVDPVAEETIAQDQLKEHFGDHTFYLSPDGVYVWEEQGESAAAPAKLQAIQIASWANDEHTLLQKQEPKRTGKSVALA